METEVATTVPSIATDLIGKLVSLIGISWVLVHALVVLRRKGWTAEINIIWYAFSLILVLWWCLHAAMYSGFVRLPVDQGLFAAYDNALAKLEKERAHPATPTAGPQRKTETELQVEELRRRLREGDPWTGQYIYQKAKKYLTDTNDELALVAIILIVTIAPQLLNYVLAGLSGCAATPKYVWQFEKIAIWSLIKFLAAFGGVSVADALSVSAISDLLFEISGRDEVVREVLRLFGFFVWGMGAVTLAFVAAGVQEWILAAAQALGKAWQGNKTSWPYRLHRHFTENVARKEDEPAEGMHQTTISPVQIWERLSLAQKQEVAALAMRSLLEGTLSAIGYPPKPSTVSHTAQAAPTGSDQ